jgi:hypothetical protein
MSGYAEFLERKTQLASGGGFDPDALPEFLFPFQRHLVAWALQQGRAAIFADCGLGKTPMQIVWADQVARRTGKPVLILTPLAVAQQTVREGEKFGIECARSHAGEIPARITVTNYERLHHFDAGDFGGCVADESSILKNFDGTRKAQVTEFMRKMEFRSLWTATAAPNDYIELGTSSEALGQLGYMDMLGRFFRNDQNTVRPVRRWTATATGWGSQSSGLGDRAKWRFKGHAETPFWKWVASWARACRKPSDLGFDDAGFILPPLEEREHIVTARTLAPGMLFALPAVGFHAEREERRRTLRERCEAAAALVADTGQSAAVWCHLNPEGDLLASLIPGALQVSGSDCDEAKEEAYEAFSSGQVRVLVTKPKIGAWGLNWQHCAHVVTFASHSYEQLYQSVRRCWRFGQARTVRVDLVASEGEAGVKDNLKRKADQAERMFAALVEHMNSAVTIARGNGFHQPAEAPEWLSLSKS